MENSIGRSLMKNNSYDKYMTKKGIKEILSITEKIENQDLDFKVKMTNLKEINSMKLSC